MSRPSIQNTRRTGGLGLTGDIKTTYSALCMNGVAVGGGGAALNTVYQLNSVNDAVQLGLTAAYDVANTVLVNYHISEFFRMCPGGKLFIMLVAQTVTLTQMCTPGVTNGVQAIIRSPLAAGQIRQWAVARNPASGYTPTITAGVDTDCIAVASSVYSGAVVQANALVELEEALHRPSLAIVEIRSSSAMTSAGLIDATASKCDNVYGVMLADNDVSVSNALYNGHAGVGTALGLRASLSSSKSLANPSIGNIQNAALAAYVNPGLSSGKLLSAYTDDLNGDQDVIYDKGFLATRVFTDMDGVFISSDRTCTVDTDDYYRGANNLVMNEADRITYATLLPFIENDLLADPSTGNLAALVVKSWESSLNHALLALTGQTSAGAAINPNTAIASSATAYIDPAQDFLSSQTIVVQTNIVPKGYSKTIKNYMGFKNPFN